MKKFLFLITVLAFTVGTAQAMWEGTLVKVFIDYEQPFFDQQGGEDSALVSWEIVARLENDPAVQVVKHKRDADVMFVIKANSFKRPCEMTVSYYQKGNFKTPASRTVFTYNVRGTELTRKTLGTCTAQLPTNLVYALIMVPITHICSIAKAERSGS